MASSPYLAVVKAEYEYTATNDEELTIQEDQVLYVLEDDDTDWWKVRVKQSPSSGSDPSEAPTGLVPAGYVVPLPSLKTVTAAYEYTATSDEEISIQENATYDLYEDDGEWSLVGARDRKEVGFAPTAYFEDAESGGAGAAPAAAVAAAPMQNADSDVGRATNGHSDPVKTWAGVTEMDGKKKKKGTLGVGNGAIFFASDSDKAPVQKKPLSNLADLKSEKGKHIYLTFADEELHFSVSSKDEHAEILAKIEESRDMAQANGVSHEAEEDYSAPPAAAGAAVPPPPPPPPPPPAAGGTAGFGALPPPPRRMYDSSDEEDDDDAEPAPRAAPAAAAFVPPPPPPPPPPMAATAFQTPPTRAATAVVSPPPAPARAQEGKKATAEYEFTAAGTEELSISEGETLWVLDDSADDWWKVRNSRGEEGEVPASYVLVEGGEGAAAADTGNDEAEAKRLQDEHKAEARKEKERLRLKALEEEARGGGFTNINIPPPPRRNAAPSPGPASGAATPTRAMSPPVAPIAGIPAPPPPPPAPGANARPPQRDQREDSNGGRDRDAEKEERRRRHREERERQRREDEILRNRGSTSMPAAPVEKTKPSPARVRTWKDRTGAFKVDAEFIGLSGKDNEKIRLHKLNGVVIEVPLDKMSPEDIRILEHLTKRRLGKDRRGDDDRRSSQAGERREDRRDRDRDDRDRRDERRRDSEREEHRARPPSATAAGKRVSMAASQTKRSEVDWFEFFLNAGCDVDDCSRYANNFEKDRIDESILPDLEASTLRSLGMREGDIIRVAKHIKNKMGSSAAASGANKAPEREREREKPARAPSPPEKETREEQLKNDEDLARKMQEELNAGRDGSGLFTNASGGIKNTRRGRPDKGRSAPSSASMDAITSSLTGSSNERTRTPDIDRVVSPDSTREAGRRSSSTAPVPSGFDDDAWTVKPTASKPKTASPTLIDGSPAPSASASQPQINRDLTGLRQETASPASMPGSSKEPSNAQALTDAYLESMGLGKRAVSSPAPARQAAASPAPAANLTPQATGYYAPSPVNNGPRAPPAPIPLNQQLLNPLVPTQTGLTGFIPTRNQPSPMMPQQTGFGGIPPFQPQPQPQMMAPMQTGYGNQGMMQPQPTGYGMPQMSQLSIQPTGSPFQQQQMPVSASPSMYNQPPAPQAPPPPPMPVQATSNNNTSSNSADYQPSNIFAQMKAGQFAKPNEAPQQEQKYDSLRPQPTGYNAGGFGGFGQAQQQYSQQTGYNGMPMQQTGFGGMQPQQTGMYGQQQQQQPQPLQAQPTGFAPGGYVGMMPQQTGMMYGQQQQPGYPYRQF